MSKRGRIAKMDSGNKAKEILAWIVEQANSGKVVCLKDDWGGNSLTIYLAIQSDEDGKILPTDHTHVGMDNHTLDQLIENFHSTVTGRGGLSWA